MYPRTTLANSDRRQPYSTLDEANVHNNCLHFGVVVSIDSQVTAGALPLHQARACNLHHHIMRVLQHIVFTHHIVDVLHSTDVPQGRVFVPPRPATVGRSGTTRRTPDVREFPQPIAATAFPAQASRL